MAFRYLVPALAIAGRAAAQCSVAATSTIQNAGDASALASCTTFQGSIAIQTSTSDNIALDGIQEITGSLIASNVPNMTTLSGDSLQRIGDSFTLSDVQILSTLNFPQLSQVPTIDWIGLANLQGLSFTTGIQKATSLSIQNTVLASLDGINLMNIDTLTLANNLYLDQVSMQLAWVSNALSMQANGRDLQVEFPNLIWANNMTIRNASSLSIPSLASVNGSMGLYSNYFTSLSAPNLTSVGQGLAFVSNEDLTNVSMPELKTIGGGFDIQNNTAYKQINGFPSVSKVGGAVDFYGNFTTAQLPALSDVRGAFNLQSSADITSTCNHFQPLSGSNNAIKGTYSCAGEESHPSGTGTLPGGTNSGSGGGSSASSSSPANPMLIPGTTGVLGVVFAIFGLL